MGMDGTVLGIWSQAAAVAAFGSTGGMLVRLRGERPGTATIGVGLLVGSLLLAVDTMQASTLPAGTSTPLAALALAVTAFLAYAGAGANPSHGLAGVLARSGLRMATFGAVLVALLHWLHGVMPHQANFGLPALDVGVVDAPLVVLLTWLALRARGVPGDVRFLLLCTAFGRLASLQFAPHGASVAAGAQVLGATPLLLRRLAADAPTLAVATATSAAFAFTCLLRTQAQLQGSTPRLAGIDDPLLVLGAVVALFGAALMRAYGREAELPQAAIAATTTAIANATADAMAESVSPSTSPSPAPNSPKIQSADVASAIAAAPTDQRDLQSTAPGTDDGATRAEPAGAAPSSSLTARDVVRDLRSPITSMVAAIGLLSPGASQDERRRQLSTLQEYGRQLSTALTDLDDFENLLRGTIDLAEDAFDLSQLLQACVDEITPSLADRGLRICLDPSPSLPRWVQGDPSRVRQLVTRVLHLATQHATVGSVDVTAAANDGQLHISFLHRNCTLPDDGRSLGLMFCSQLALVLGGELSLQPAGDNGFQLLLKLPHRAAPAWEVELLEEDVERAAPAQPSGTPAAQVRGRVLLVEDSPDHQLLIGRLLDRAGAQVTMASTGEVALHLSEQQSFDLILLDMQMPGIDGYQTVRTWRERGLLTPVLALTADTSTADVERCLAAGCNGHLAKPIAPALLRRSLAMHLPAAANT